MKSTPNLTGVPETMLWTLHNRASEARRPDRTLDDPHALRIYDALDYDYAKSFGEPDDSHSMRSRLFDQALRPWMAEHPGGCIVNLGEGLETQTFRIDDGKAHWVTVDLPEAIAIRERFIVPDRRRTHLAQSALDLSWMDAIDPARGVFVTAQGLLMYFEEVAVQRLLVAVAERFPEVELMFDTIPRWLSAMTVGGFAKTSSYRTPPMPWGINANELKPTLRRWSSRLASVEQAPYGLFRGLRGVGFSLFTRVPVLKHGTPQVVRVRTPPKSAR